MPDRAACERRVYRLAAILTGDPIKATTVISQVVGSKPNLAELDSAHMDRLTVLRSREIRPATLVSDEVPLGVATALQALPAQQREAWVFARVYQTPPREMSRAMDCSSTAAERHLQLASAAMARVAGGADADAARSFLRYSMSLDVPEFYRAAQRRRRRLRLAMLLVVIGILALAIAALAMWWSRPLDGRESIGAATPEAARAARTEPATSRPR
jgi:hypothetical protein